MRTLWLLAAALMLLVVACGTGSASGPPEINYGRDICIECGMIIDDPRFAAAYTLEDGSEKKFDDLGGLIVHAREVGELDSAEVWVHDFETEDWLEATQAFYVPTLGVTSPMGHGILAFADKDRAVQTADVLGGEVISWAEVRELPVMEGLLGHHHDEDAEGSDMDHDMDSEMDHEMDEG